MGGGGLKQIHLPLFTDGVTMFFVISGFLITYLLIQEKDKTTNINIPKFYVRRILRIWPIYYLYILAAIGVLFLLGKEAEIINKTLIFYIFFAANIPFLSASGIALIVHYWSIGVEEQFYLFWPWLVKFTKKKLFWTAFTVFSIWIILKFGSYVLYTNQSIIYKFFNVTRFHCMMIGALGAILYRKKNKLFFMIFTNKWSQTTSWLIFILSGFFFNYIPALIRAEVVSILSLFLIMSQIEGKPKFINLENKYFDFVGKISYGIYIIHPVIIFILSNLWIKIQLPIPYNIQYIIIYSIVSIITIFIAWVSYEYFEKPFLKLKNKFAVVKSANSMQLK